MFGLDVDRPKAFLLADADERPAQKLEHGDKGHDGLEAVFRLQDEREQLDRSPAEPVGDECELFLQRPGPPCDHNRSRWNSREDAVEGHDEEPDLERLLLAPRVHSARWWRKGDGILRGALHEAFSHLLVGPILLEPLPDLLLPAEQVGLVLGRRLAGQKADRLQQQQPRRHPQELGHLFWIGDLARRDLDEICIGDSRQGNLEDVDLLAFSKCKEQLQWAFEDGRLDIQSGRVREITRTSDRRFHVASLYLAASSWNLSTPALH